MSGPGLDMVDEALVGRLIRDQCPEYARERLSPVPNTGTAHALFRLGSDFVVSLPLNQEASLQCQKEHQWLHTIAATVPTPVPVPIHKGSPSTRYPSHWSIFQWFKGMALWDVLSLNKADLALDVARFISALSSTATAGGPAPGSHNFGRGVDLCERDRATRAALDRCDGLVPVEPLREFWNRALGARPSHRPAWIHGDLHGGNIIIHEGKLAAIIDFGGLAVGDPACDLAFAWYVLDRLERDLFRRQLARDDEEWRRAKGWALSVAAIQLPYYRGHNTHMERLAMRTLSAVLEDGARNTWGRLARRSAFLSKLTFVLGVGVLAIAAILSATFVEVEDAPAQS